MIRGSGLEFRGRQPEDEQSFEIQWVSAAGGEPQFVTSVDVAPALRFHPQVHWSSDGTRLYYGRPLELKGPATIRRRISCPFASTAPIGSRCCGFRRSTTWRRRRMGSGSCSRRATRYT